MTFQPLLPWPILIGAVLVALGLTALRLRGDDRPRAPVFRSLGMILLVAFIALDPAVTGGKVAALRSDADVLFVVDTTGSMAAEDYNGDAPRLDGVRADLLALVAEFPGAHFGLITFDSKARMVVPWTTDIGAVTSAVELLRQERTMYARGSALDLPVPAMARALPRTEDGSTYSVVFYVSEGEQTADADEPDLRSLRPSIDAGAVLGYGTTEGGRMRLYTGREGTLDQYIPEPETDEDAISRIDEETLNAIAADLGIRYVHRTEPAGIADLAAGIADGARTERDGSRDGDRRLYWIPAFGVVALALWQLAATALEIAEARRAIGRPARRAARRWAR